MIGRRLAAAAFSYACTHHHHHHHPPIVHTPPQPSSTHHHPPPCMHRHPPPRHDCPHATNRGICMHMGIDMGGPGAHAPFHLRTLLSLLWVTFDNKMGAFDGIAQGTGKYQRMTSAARGTARGGGEQPPRRPSTGATPRAAPSAAAGPLSSGVWCFWPWTRARVRRRPLKLAIGCAWCFWARVSCRQRGSLGAVRTAAGYRLPGL